MKIGILTFHCAHNYGAILQCYALQECLAMFGFEVEVIDYRPEFLVNPYKVFQRYRFSLRHPYRLPYEIYREVKYALPRWVRFEKSIKNLLKLSKQYKEVPGSYDVYIIGSDQIWNTRISRGDINYFSAFQFKKQSKKYIAYAASMEALSLSSQDKELCERYLPNFDAIGVRESNLLGLLKPFYNGWMDEVLDPVFLLSKEQWANVARHPRVDEPYVLLYQVREDKRAEMYAEQIAIERKCKLIELCSFVKRNDSVGIAFQTSSVEEFVGLFMNANFIVTSSFHGTVFSIIFEKKFYALKLGDGADSRIEQLLRTFNLDYHLVDLDNTAYEEQNTNYAVIKEMIRNRAELSRGFLIDAINK